jgi:uncharacterized protein YndB with AHSA1/START domain
MAAALISRSTAMRTDESWKTIAATPGAIYAALMDADARAEWLPPAGMTGRFERFDARPGGGYRMVLTYKDASAAPGKSSVDSDVVVARFIELVPHKQVVEAVEFESDDPSFAGTMTMTWTLIPVAGGTQVTITAENVPSGIAPADHAAGLNGSLENLARFVEPRT